MIIYFQNDTYLESNTLLKCNKFQFINVHIYFYCKYILDNHHLLANTCTDLDSTYFYSALLQSYPPTIINFLLIKPAFCKVRKIVLES